MQHISEMQKAYLTIAVQLSPITYFKPEKLLIRSAEKVVRSLKEQVKPKLNY